MKLAEGESDEDGEKFYVRRNGGMRVVENGREVR